MKDLIVIVMTVAFFAITVGYVALCDRIIGPDEVVDGLAATTVPTTLHRRLRHRRRRRRPASGDHDAEVTA